MSVSGVSSSSRKTRKTALGGRQKLHRFIGISLSGGRSDKACVAVMEYFPEHNKIFLARLFEKIKTEENISADLKIQEIIEQHKESLEWIAFDAPLSMPVCVTCKLRCPGYENCNESEIQWMRQHYEAVNKKKKPKKLFTPYTQRSVEAYISHSLEENFEIHHALGSNNAPLAARAQFIRRRLQIPCIEVFPKLSIWRVGQEIRVAKSHLKYHKHSVGGDESRRVFLQSLQDSKDVFIYQQDMKAMTENNHAFEAMICALTAFLKFQKKTAAKPAGFPKLANWIEFPA
jgi:hypothetical protein